jgi:hypothetical protein
MALQDFKNAMIDPCQADKQAQYGCCNLSRSVIDLHNFLSNWVNEVGHFVLRKLSDTQFRAIF